MRTKGMPPRQAYNAQAAVNEQQIILTAEITVDAPDFGHLEPMVSTTLTNLERHGVTEQPGAVLADAGYWHTRQIQQLTDSRLDVLVPPDGAMRDGKRPGWEEGLYEVMREKLKTERGHGLYKLRKITIEPVYGQIKYNRRVEHFMRRRQIRRAVRVAAGHSNPQPLEAPHPLDRQHRLTRHHGSSRSRPPCPSANRPQNHALSGYSGWPLWQSTRRPGRGAGDCLVAKAIAGSAARQNTKALVRVLHRPLHVGRDSEASGSLIAARRTRRPCSARAEVWSRPRGSSPGRWEMVVSTATAACPGGATVRLSARSHAIGLRVPVAF